MKIAEFFKKNSLVISVGLILFTALFIRLSQISEPNLWRDEAFSVNASRESVGKIFEISSSDTQPPLHILAIKLFTIFFGYGESSVRGVSLIFGIVALLFIYKTASLLISDKKITISILLAASFSPLLIFYSVEARAYSMLLAFFAISLFYFIKIFSDKEDLKTSWFLFTASIIFGLYTHNLFVVSAAIFYFLLLAKLIVNEELYSFSKILKMLNTFKKRRHIHYLLISTIIVTVFYLPWCYFLVEQYSKISNQGFWLTFDPYKSTIDSFNGMIVGHNFQNSSSLFQKFMTGFLPLITVFLIAISFVKTLIAAIKNKNVSPQFTGVILFLMNFFIIWAVSFKTPFLYIRYIMYLYPIFLLSIFVSSNFLANNLKKAILAFAIIFALSSSTMYFAYSAGYDGKERFEDATLYIDKVYNPTTDLVLVPNAASFHSADYYSQLLETQFEYYIFNPKRDFAHFEGLSTLKDSDFYEGDFQGVEKVFLAQLWSSSIENDIISYGFELKETQKYSGVEIKVFSKI